MEEKQIIIGKEETKMDQHLDLWDVIMNQPPRKDPIYRWSVEEVLDLWEILKVAGLLEIYYDSDPSFRRIANRLYNLFFKE